MRKVLQGSLSDRILHDWFIDCHDGEIVEWHRGDVTKLFLVEQSLPNRWLLAFECDKDAVLDHSGDAMALCTVCRNHAPIVGARWWVNHQMNEHDDEYAYSHPLDFWERMHFEHTGGES